MSKNKKYSLKYHLLKENEAASSNWSDEKAIEL